MLEFLTQDFGGHKVFFYPRIESTQESLHPHNQVTKIGIEAFSLNYFISSYVYGRTSLQESLGIGLRLGLLGMITWDIHDGWDFHLPQGIVWFITQDMLQSKS